MKENSGQQKLSKKQLVILSILAAFLLFIFIFLLLPFTTGQGANYQNLNNKSLSPAAGIFATPTQEITTKIFRYKNDDYSLDYPDSWTINLRQLNDMNGSLMVLQPKISKIGTNPHIAVQVTDAGPSSIASMEAGFAVLKYKKESAIVSGTSADQFTGTLPSPQGLLHNIAFIFESKNRLFLIKLSYTQHQQDPQLEEQFKRIASTFTLL